MAILKKGLAGEPVRRLQTKLGVEADGDFGPATEKALKDWQTKNGLAADGVAGPDTFMAMALYELVLLKQGTRGDTVKKLQEKLGVGADGQFGPGTEKALRDYQGKNGLAADGLAGPATLAQMKLFKEITAETVKSSQVPAASVGSQTGTPAGATADAGAGLRSIWDTIKSVFK
jgi:peptidoglycan hydrolase-like protein with peptidoglycan-binding domain